MTVDEMREYAKSLRATLDHLGNRGLHGTKQYKQVAATLANLLVEIRKGEKCS